MLHFSNNFQKYFIIIYFFFHFKSSHRYSERSIQMPFNELYIVTKGLFERVQYKHKIFLEVLLCISFRPF